MFNNWNYLKRIYSCLCYFIVTSLFATRIFAFEYHESAYHQHDSVHESSYPSWLSQLMIWHGGWNPEVPSHDQLCLNEISKTENKIPLKNKDIEKIAEKCQLKNKLNLFNQQASRLYTHFDFEKNQFKKVEFKIKEGVLVRGLLGLQNQNAPLVILRLGIHGNRDEVLAERFIARALYEDLKVHVLILESTSSHGYILQNNPIGFGAIEEGLQTFYVLNVIRESQMSDAPEYSEIAKWSKKINKINLVGVSLAGAGVFFAHLLDSTSLIQQKKQPQIKSLELFCPLINFEENFKVRSEKTFFNAMVDMWNRRRLISLKEKKTELFQFSDFLTVFDFKVRFSARVIDWLNSYKHPVITEGDFKQQFKNLRFDQTVSDFLNTDQTLLQKLNFWSLYQISNSAPITIYSTPNDPLVNNQVNIDQILNHQQVGQFNHVQVVKLNGVHCAFPAEYEWPFITFILKNGLEH